MGCDYIAKRWRGIMKWSGKKIMEGVEAARKNAVKKYACPSCSRISVKRVSAGVWKCAKCNAKYASGTYEFS